MAPATPRPLNWRASGHWPDLLWGYCPDCSLPIADRGRGDTFGLHTFAGSFIRRADGRFLPWKPKPTGHDKTPVPGGFRLQRDDGTTTVEPEDYDELDPAAEYEVVCPGWPPNLRKKRRGGCGALLLVRVPR